MKGDMRHPRDQKGQGVSEIVSLRAEDASGRKRWYRRKIDGLGTSEVQETWKKRTPIERGCMGSELERLGASKGQEDKRKYG